MRFRKHAPLALAALSSLSAASLALAHEPVDLNAVTRIREQAFEHSKVMDILWNLTDKLGPRLTNSTEMFRAARWARDRLTEMGMDNARLEPWGEFGMGWSFQRCRVEMTDPTYMPMIAIPRAWTSGTNGEIKGVPVYVDADNAEDLEEYKGNLAGKIVLVGPVNPVDTPFEPLAKRHDAESLAALAKPRERGGNNDFARRFAEFRRLRALRNAMNKMFKEEGVAAIITHDNGRYKDYGVISLGSGGSRDPDDERALPQVIVSREQFNRVARLLEHGEEVQMAVDVKTSFQDDDLTGYDIVAEIPGSDPALRDQVVMIGGHFDSWHPATGATDNGAGSAVMMEVMRIIKDAGLKPRRTIRIALWTGEEQGLLGSRGYVKNHFADRATMELKPEHSKLAAYFNMDNGGGRLHGVYLEGNASVAPIFRAWMKPFEDLGMTTLTMRGTGGTDHLSFQAVGLPGFQFIQDQMDYSTRSHHTNMDLYERVKPFDVEQSAAVIASFAYHAAMRDDMLPRGPLPKPTRRRGRN